MSLFGVPVFPEQASSFAMDVDALYVLVIAIAAFFALLIAALVIGVSVKYRRRPAGEAGARIEGNLALELLWSVIPTVIAMVMFGWSASALRTTIDAIPGRYMEMWFEAGKPGTYHMFCAESCATNPVELADGATVIVNETAGRK